MSRVDWSLAPALATHAGTFKGEFTCWYWLNPCGTWRYISDLSDDWERVVANKPVSDLTERPKQPIAWSGDGSIPMGAEVEIHHSCWNASEWLKCKILYMSDAYVIVNHWGLDEQHYHARDITVRAIPTPAQLRESAIRELMDIAQVDCRVTAARLVDAGFKREVK